MGPESTALVATALLGSVLAFRLRRILDLSCTGVFFASHFVFVLVGVLAAPWLLRSPLPASSFPFLHWDYLSDADVSRAIAIVTTGLISVAGGHLLGEAIHRSLGGAPARWGALLAAPRPKRNRVRVPITTIAFLGLAAGATGLALTKASTILTGIRSGYLGGDIAAQYDARFAMQDLGRVFYLTVFNAIPFLALLAFLRSREAASRIQRGGAWAQVAIAAGLLLITFEKRPLVLFALTLFLAGVLTEVWRKASPAQTSARALLSLLPWRRLGIGAGSAFIILFAFYLISTRIVANFGLGSEAVLLVAGIVVVRVFGRLAAMPLFYAHFFPAVHAFYGVDNIGLLAALTGRPVYQDTVEVYSYFSSSAQGTGAIGALTDYYAAFGWPGLIIGSGLTGLGLYLLDQWLPRLAPTHVNRTFWFMMLVFVSALSQASLARSLSTYGGAVFIALWCVLSIDPMPRSTPTDTTAAC